MDDALTLPIFHNATLALALMDRANAHDDEIRAAVAQHVTASEALAKARRAHARGARVGPAFPKEDLAVL
jgi:hypothetical protein